MSTPDVPREAGYLSLSRRGFLRVTVAGAVPVLLSACAAPQAPAAATSASKPAAPTAAAAPATVAVAQPTSVLAPTPAAAPKPAAAAASGPYPTYIPFTGGPKPDYHDDKPIFADGFENYPASPFKANPSAPGAGGVVNVLIAAYFPVPTPYEQNPTWQAVNKQLNADVRMNIIPTADYRTKFATTLASDDLPDIMHIYFGYSVAPNLPQFFKSKCADLTPYLSGDAAKDYPYLAAIPSAAWKNSTSAIDGQLFLVPIHRPMYSVSERYPYGGNLFRNTDMYDTEIGQDYVPKDADDLMRILKTLNRPQENRWAIGKPGTAGTIFGLGTYAEMFGAPNQWKLDSGKLIKDRETEEYKAAVAYLRDVMTANLYPPDAATNTNSRADFVAKKIAMSVESQGNSWVDFWQRGQQLTPPTRFAMLPPFAAVAGQKPIYYLSPGFNSMNVLKKAPPDRIKELLRIMNWLASPFGSQEDLLLTYGLEGQDYKNDDKGNPVPSTEGISRAGYVPWRYVVQHPWVYYQADLPGFAKASYGAEHATLPLGIDDPTNGFYAPTFYGKGVVADNTFFDGVREIVLGRSPMSDYDGLVKEWSAAAGDQIKAEYLQAMSAAT
jgi:putative aldouronate transport system substrate-binding protein